MKGSEHNRITASMTILDIVSIYPLTEKVFESYNERVGECLCCQMLFETIEKTAQQYKLDLTKLLSELNSTCDNQ